QPGSARTLSRGWFSTSRPRNADGADVGLDRRRRARERFHAARGAAPAVGRGRGGKPGCEVPRISPRRLAVVTWHARRLGGRHFTAARLMKATLPDAAPRASVFYANHASWWQPLVMLLFARAVFPGVAFHAPIDAAALARYPSLKRLGFFGSEPGSSAGA